MGNTGLKIWRGIRNPAAVANLVVMQFKLHGRLTEASRVRCHGERVVIRDWESARKSRNMGFLAHINRYEWALDKLVGLRCLDAGCGSGYGTHYLACHGAAEVTGVDISDVAIAYCRKRYSCENLCSLRMDVTDLEFPDDSFDAAISFDVLEHLPEKSQARFISNLARVVRDNGVVIVGCPKAASTEVNNPFHLHELTREEFESLLLA